MALWTPSDLATAPRLWLDAREPLTLSGTDVVLWPDQAGDLDATQNTDNQRPEFGAVQINGQDVVTFTGEERMDLPALGVTGSQNRAVFAVVNLTGQAVGREVVLSLGDGGSTFQRWSIAFNNSESLRIEIAGAGWNGPAASGTNVIGVVLDGTTLADHTVYMNAVPTTASGTSTIDTVDIGNVIGGRNTNLTATRSHAELIFLSYAPTDDEIDQITGYLAHGWGLAGELPAGHPYKAEAPSVADPAPEPVQTQGLSGQAVAARLTGQATRRIIAGRSGTITLET